MESILSLAREQEKSYDWPQASESYQKGLDLISETELGRRAGLQEDLAYAFYRASMQAENQNQFRERIVQAVSAYGRASEFYAKLSSEGKQARCDAVLAYMKYWFADNFAEKASMLNEAWKLAKAAFKLFRDDEELAECARTYNQLSDCASPMFA